MKSHLRSRIFLSLGLLCVGFVALLLFVLHQLPVSEGELKNSLSGEALLFLTRTSTYGFSYLVVGLFTTFSLLMALIFSRVTKPLKKILNITANQPIPVIEDRALLLARDEFGQLARLVGHLGKQLKEREEAFNLRDVQQEALLEALDEGVIIFDADLCITNANRVGSKIFKVPKEELVGKKYSELADKISQPLWKKGGELLRGSLETLSVMVGTLQSESGGKAYLDLRASPLSFGRGVVLIIQDISSQYKVLEMGRDFVANASHELRTPITIIKGFAETLHDVPEISSAMLEDITDKIVRNCHRMNTLVKNLLLLADLDSFSKTRLQSCDLVTLIDDSSQTLLSLHPEVMVETLYNKQEVIASIDPDLLELAIFNLLQNAVKYSQGDAQIRITIEEKEKEILLHIADKGMGIPPKDLPYIFDRFYTVDKAHSRKLGGAGLGLSIVKRIIEKHEGSVHVSSVLNQGTTFTIVLPRA